MTIRYATTDDAKDLIAIYTPYVLKTAITFEYQVPSLETFKKRIASISKRFPYLVYEKKGQVPGYAYASSYKERAVYDWSCEVSIYVSEKARGKSIGTQLYDALEHELAKSGITTCLACITYPNTPSEVFHHHRWVSKSRSFHPNWL